MIVKRLAIGIGLVGGILAGAAPGLARTATAREAAEGVAPPLAETTCVTCHLELEEDLGPQVKEWRESVHARVGVGCHDCHGGDPTIDDEIDAKRKETGFLGFPEEPDEVGPFCARCHGDIEYMRRFNPSMRVDQYQEYLTSRHGKAVHQEESTRAATCVDCHGQHAILRASDPRAPVYPTNVAATCGHCHADASVVGSAGLPTDVVERWRESVHASHMEAGDLSAPTCNDCHGNHGAVPPGVRDVAHVCGRCHTSQEEHFEAGSHLAHFQKMGKAPCITCHDNHAIQAPTDDLLMSEEPGVCGLCHQPDDHCDLAARHMLGRMRSYVHETRESEDLLASAERLGMDVSAAQFRLSDVRDQLTMARVVVHRFSKEEFDEVLDAGTRILQGIRDEAGAAHDEWEFRRMGLFVALVLILVVIVLLTLKVRKLDRLRQAESAA